MPQNAIVVNNFREDLLSTLGRAPELITPDGSIHRFETSDKAGDQAGYCALFDHGDGFFAGFFGDFRTGFQQTWHSKNGGELTHADRERINQAKAQAKAERKRVQVEAAERAKAILDSSTPAPGDHPYLVKKQIKPHGARADKHGNLILPVQDMQGTIHSLQFIDAEGSKKFLTGGKVAGGYFPLKGSDPKGPVYIAEGFATAASIHEAMDGRHYVLAAFNAGNLNAVAEAVRGRDPDRQIVICAEDDHKTEGNPGITAGKKAAAAVGAKVTWPEFSEGQSGSDFNDLAMAQGLGAVRSRLEDASVAETAAAWPQPVPLDQIVAPPISLDTIPENLREFCESISDALQVPNELVLMNLLGAIAVAVQRKFKVQVDGGYHEPLNVFMACSLPPAERKSPTVEVCKRPLVLWEAEQRKMMKDIVKEAESEHRTMGKVIERKRGQAAKASQDKLKVLISEIQQLESELPEVPTIPRLLADDLTPEALAELMSKHEQRIGVIEAEGGLFDTLGGRYSNGVPNLDAVLKSWGGEAVYVDRRGRDSIIMTSPELTLCLSPQPSVVQGLANHPAFRGRGLVGRFLFWMPRSRLGSRRASAKSVPPDVASRYRQMIQGLLEIPFQKDEEGNVEPYSIKLSPEAIQSRDIFAEKVETELGPGGDFEQIGDWAGKLPGNAVRLAGLLHCAIYDDPRQYQISGQTIKSALSLASQLAEHAKAAFQLMGTDEDMECARAVMDWIHRDRVQSFTGRDALEKVKGRFPTMKKVNAGLEVLEDRCHVQKIEAERSGPGRKPSPIYSVNPKFFQV